MTLREWIKKKLLLFWFMNFTRSWKTFPRKDALRSRQFFQTLPSLKQRLSLMDSPNYWKFQLELFSISLLKNIERKSVNLILYAIINSIYIILLSKTILISYFQNKWWAFLVYILVESMYIYPLAGIHEFIDDLFGLEINFTFAWPWNSFITLLIYLMYHFLSNSFDNEATLHSVFIGL